MIDENLRFCVNCEHFGGYNGNRCWDCEKLVNEIQLDTYCQYWEPSTRTRCSTRKVKEVELKKRFRIMWGYSVDSVEVRDMQNAKPLAIFYAQNKKIDRAKALKLAENLCDKLNNER